MRKKRIIIIEYNDVNDVNTGKVYNMCPPEVFTITYTLDSIIINNETKQTNKTKKTIHSLSIHSHINMNIIFT